MGGGNVAKTFHLRIKGVGATAWGESSRELFQPHIKRPQKSDTKPPHTPQHHDYTAIYYTAFVSLYL